MKVLSIGNSFSQDAQRYLHRIARSDGVKLDTDNLYIGGCSLRRHHANMQSREAAYELEYNGMSTGSKISLFEALNLCDWDVITLQEASKKSTNYELFQPYLSELLVYVKKHAPHAKIAIHQTWAYEQDSELLNNVLGYSDQEDMFADVKSAYEKAAEAVNADMLIPSGALFQKLLHSGISKVHRDTFHASYGLGRYALGLLWYAVLINNDVAENNFAEFDEPISAREIEIVKRCVAEICNKR